MGWPLLACILLPGLLIYFGLHILRREIIFVDLALAQIASLGACVGIVLGFDSHHPANFLCSGAFTLFGALVFSLLRSFPSKVPQEAFIGIIYVVAAALSILLLSRTVEGGEELQKTLIGEVLLVSGTEVLWALLFFGIIGLVHYIFRRQFLALSFPAYAGEKSGPSPWVWEFLFYVLFGFAVTKFVHIGGVLLVFSYLIIPAACATLLVESFSTRLLLGWCISLLSTVVGCVASYKWDFPTGSAIVCALALPLLAIVPITVKMKRA